MYKFNPAEYNFTDVPIELRDYIHSDAFFKKIAIHDKSYWFFTCRKCSISDCWFFESGLSTGYGVSLTQIYVGCITSKKYAEMLLIHLFGARSDNGVMKVGKERMLAKSL